MRFYPEGAAVPAELRTGEFLVRMLRATDVTLDYDAVMSSAEILRLHSGGSWPRDGFTIEENLADLERHEAEFHARTSFTYTVMNPTETECLGCLYIYPLALVRERLKIAPEGFPLAVDHAAEATFWVHQSRHADDLDRRFLAAVLPWLRRDFAFSQVYLLAYARERRQVEILRAAGLSVVFERPVDDTTLLLFA